MLQLFEAKIACLVFGAYSQCTVVNALKMPDIAANGWNSDANVELIPSTRSRSGLHSDHDEMQRRQGIAELPAHA